MFARVECRKCGACNHVPADLPPGTPLYCRDCGYRIVPGPGRPTDEAEVREEPEALVPDNGAPVTEAAGELPMPSSADVLPLLPTEADSIPPPPR
jgi:hypothetical protein